MRIVLHCHQHGAVIVIVTVSLVLLFLLGFMGVALDFNRLFIVKSDLQAAMNNCALAAAKELDGQSTALTRAASAGQTAGNTNNVNLQSSAWSSQNKIASAKITFKDASYVATTIPANAKYAQCQHTESGIKLWLLHSIEVFSGNAADYSNSQNFITLAVASQVNTKTTCPVKAIPDEMPIEFKGNAEAANGLIDSPISILLH